MRTTSRSARRARASRTHGARGEPYQALKRRLTERLLAAVGRVVPGIEKRVIFCELGTPLTNRFYVEASFGNVYGIEKSRLQVGPFSYPVRTEIGGLLLCGASTLGHGVFGATLSGLVAAARAAGCRTRDLVPEGASGPPLRIYPSEQPEAWPVELRRRMSAGVAVGAGVGVGVG